MGACCRHHCPRHVRYTEAESTYGICKVSSRLAREIGVNFPASLLLMHGDEVSPMRSNYMLSGVLGLMLLCAGCGGSYSAPSPSPTPTPTPTPGASATVNILGDRGANSFTPNPAAPGAALTLAWKNTDGT